MKISMKMWFCSKIYMSKCTKAVEWISRQGLEIGSIDILLKRIYNTCRIVRQPSSSRDCVRCAAMTILRRWWTSCSDKPKTHRLAREISRETDIKCAQHNSPQSAAQMLQTTSCSAVIWSQSRRPFHYLINNLTVCNKSCYCSFINHKLNNK